MRVFVQLSPKCGSRSSCSLQGTPDLPKAPFLEVDSVSQIRVCSRVILPDHCRLQSASLPLTFCRGAVTRVISATHVSVPEHAPNSCVFKGFPATCFDVALVALFGFLETWPTSERRREVQLEPFWMVPFLGLL